MFDLSKLKKLTEPPKPVEIPKSEEKKREPRQPKKESIDVSSLIKRIEDIEQKLMELELNPIPSMRSHIIIAKCYDILQDLVRNKKMMRSKKRSQKISTLIHEIEDFIQ